MDYRTAAGLVDSSMIWSRTRAGSDFWCALQDNLVAGNIQDPRQFPADATPTDPREGLRREADAIELRAMLRAAGTFPKAVRELDYMLGDQGNVGPAPTRLTYSQIRKSPGDYEYYEGKDLQPYHRLRVLANGKTYWLDKRDDEWVQRSNDSGSISDAYGSRFVRIGLAAGDRRLLLAEKKL